MNAGNLSLFLLNHKDTKAQRHKEIQRKPSCLRVFVSPCFNPFTPQRFRIQVKYPAVNQKNGHEVLIK